MPNLPFPRCRRNPRDPIGALAGPPTRFASTEARVGRVAASPPRRRAPAHGAAGQSLPDHLRRIIPSRKPADLPLGRKRWEFFMIQIGTSLAKPRIFLRRDAWTRRPDLPDRSGFVGDQ